MSPSTSPHIDSNGSSARRKRVLLLGATGTIGQATLRALVARGYQVTCFVRQRDGIQSLLAGAELRFCDVTDPASLAQHGFRDDQFDALVSCLASRTGTKRDAQRIDYESHKQILAQAKASCVKQFVLLSAICVQKPLLAFQRAKRAFEDELIASGLTYSIIRPTAFFKSLSGQIERVRAGKPFMVFGNGELTACKPISDDDLGGFIADCLDDETKWNQILPIGGRGEAITPLQQADILFAALGREPKIQSVPVGFLKFIQKVLAILGFFSSKMADKAELASIGLYYATESMLVLNPETGLYDAQATPSTGTEKLADHYARFIRGEVVDDRGDHAVF